MTTTEKEEIDKILKRYIATLLKGRKDKEKNSSYRIISEKTPHGIYIYDKKSRLWNPVTNDKIIDTGYYVLYFSNSRCIACKLFDFSWYTFIETIGRNYDNIKFIIVRCEWFTISCKSNLAKSFFEKFDITSSPSLILIKAENGEIVHKKHIKGVKTPDEIVEEIEDFIHNFI